MNKQEKDRIYMEAKTESDIESITFKGKTYLYYNVEKELWEKMKDAYITKRTKIRKKLTGGFVLGNQIFIDKSRKIGRRKLIIHEVGHTLGLGHTWKPTIMNPTWLFRWLNRL